MDDRERTMPLPCLTVMQPWATLAVIGAKRAETRDWTRPGLVGRRIAIHAASRWTPAQAAFTSGAAPIRRALEAAGYRAGPDGAFRLPLGAVVGTARISAFVEYASLSAEDWRRVAAAAMGDQDHGRFAWLLDDAEAFAQPLPAAGQRGLWSWSPPVAA